MDCMKDLPVNVLSNIVSYTHGEPEYVKIKHSEALKTIQTNIRFQDLVLKWQDIWNQAKRYTKLNTVLWERECHLVWKV